MSNKPKIKKRKVQPEDICICCRLRAIGLELQAMADKENELQHSREATSEDGEVISRFLLMSLLNASTSALMASDAFALLPNDMKEVIPNYSH